MDESDPKTEVKPGMHGGLNFVLLSFPGFVAGIGAILAYLQLANSSGARGDSRMTMFFSLGACALFMGALFIGSIKRWGWSGFLLGMSGPFMCCALIAAICGGK